ncbi:MAG: hypothetical protein QQN41_11255 [Nitrosopumilus sp.]
MSLENCPKCKVELKDYRPKKKRSGCNYCEPKCRYCGEYLKGFLMEHLAECKVFQKKAEEGLI